MTHLPGLERELDAAARRRFSGSPRTGWPRARLLVPAVAALVLLVAVSGVLRTSDPEVEAPAGPPAAPAVTTLQDLDPGPLGSAAGTPVDPEVEPVILRLADAAGARWVVAAYVSPEGHACTIAAAVGQRSEVPGGAGNCGDVGVLGEMLDDREPLWDMDATEESRIAYGLLAGPGTERVEVTIGSVTERAALSDHGFDPPVTDAERRAGGIPPGRNEVLTRLFAVAFTDEEVPGDPDATPARLRVTYGDGEVVDTEVGR